VGNKIAENKLARNKIEIHFCSKCKWLLRSAWMAQELMETFEEELVEVSLVKAEAGEFYIYANSKMLWSRKEMGGFPEIKQLKQIVRDALAPEKSLGHSDVTKNLGDEK